MRRFSPYPEYKDSGIEWLGEVPAHWEKLKLSRISYEKCDGPFGSAIKSEHYRDSGVRVIRLQNIKKNFFNGEDAAYIDADYYYQEISKSDVVGGDLLVAGLGDDNNVVGRACVAPCSIAPAMVKADCFRFRLDTTRVLPGFLAYQLSAGAEADAGLLSTGSTRSRIPLSTMGTRMVVLPTRDEQVKVSAFLDHETSRIDTLVEEQQRLIELLKEKRQTVISHAVTKGLNPDVTMKDSGVEWLGEVPAHWNVASLRRALQTIEQGWSPECFNFPADEGMWGVLKAGAVNNGVYRDAENKTLPDGVEPKSNIEVVAGDLLMCRASGSPELIGSAAYVKLTRPKLMLSDKLFRLVVSQGVCPEFIALSLGSVPLRRQIELSINGAEGLANNLSKASIKNLKISLPPWSEQRQIVAEIMVILNGIEEQLDLASDTVEFLQERRSALISAAVTGKIDVRGWQPPAGSPAPTEITQTEAV
ncbi:restriction endonuclease subunit S [Halomonas cerina]|uniref:Type I restriction enzyme S subunit n=1 Tax=Halomonas cerina TaxID=447424 RepID=A0A839VGJ6_9GAMM|nr:restriction endonuclease subunit S [Halomonas cerina]MBB3192449.1 type I restriction enzyme S subunit [Halomonas cerina]